MTNKFVLNYKKAWPAEEKDDSATQKGSPPRSRSYLHDHRVKDSLDEYREKLEE